MRSSSNTSNSESRLLSYVEALTGALGHADRAAPFRSYCTGLLLPGDRKSVEPKAAKMEPGRVQAAHQSLHHFVAKADWSDDTVLEAVRALERMVQPVERAVVLPAVEVEGRSFGIARHWQPVLSTYISPFINSRRSTVRLFPPRLAARPPAPRGRRGGRRRGSWFPA